MQTDQKQPSHRSLAETLKSTLASEDDRGPSIGELTGAVGDKGFGLLLIVLSLPSALPVPAVGYSTPFGICMAIIAVQIFIGKKHLSLPARLKKIRIPLKMAQKMVGFAAKFLQKTETLVKPRHQWMHSKAGHSALSVVILMMAVFMMIPFPGTNTLPAMAIFVIGVSMAEEDGLIAIAAILLSLLAAAFSGWLTHLFITAGPEKAAEFKDFIKDWIKARFGMSA